MSADLSRLCFERGLCSQRTLALRDDLIQKDLVIRHHGKTLPLGRGRH